MERVKGSNGEVSNLDNGRFCDDLIACWRWWKRLENLEYQYTTPETNSGVISYPDASAESHLPNVRHPNYQGSKLARNYSMHSETHSLVHPHPATKSTDSIP